LRFEDDLAAGSVEENITVGLACNGEGERAGNHGEDQRVLRAKRCGLVAWGTREDRLGYLVDIQGGIIDFNMKTSGFGDVNSRT